MKQVQMVEITSFIDTALQYFQHVTEAIKSDVRDIHLFYHLYSVLDIL